MFELPKRLVDEYRARPVPFGWGGVGEVAFYRTYSRKDNPKAPGPQEGWADVCERTINGMYQLQETWCRATGVQWNQEKARQSACEAFDLMFRFRWSPPGRGLSNMGTPFIMQRGVVEALQNCGFISTEYIEEERGDFFHWLMEMSMLGVGVGFDTRGADRLPIFAPHPTQIRTVVIPDTREGWALSVELLIDSYLYPDRPTIDFNYDLIRAKGALIHGLGGTASGPDPLIALHEEIRTILDNRTGARLDSRTIVDLCKLIGVCVVSGNVRRSSEIALGAPTDETFINLKNYTLYPERAKYGWVSNNSILAEVGMDYRASAERTWTNGEPGYFWLDNARRYGRMNGTLDVSDSHVLGCNPCTEQPLHHRELCTLVEIYLPHCVNKREFARAIKYAYLYGKAVTLASEQITDLQSRAVMLQNRRIGLSITGVTQFMGIHGPAVLADWLDHGYDLSGYYDQLYSQWLGIGRSIRRTSVKPGGTVPLVAGVTPGAHFNIASRYHLRRITLDNDSSLLAPLQAAGYTLEASAYTTNSTVVAFPVDAGPGVKSEDEVTPAEQLAVVELLQRHWSDNAVSATIKFDRDETSADDLAQLLTHCQHRLKGISFLPKSQHGYVQAPYESISAADYARLTSQLRPLALGVVGDQDKYTELYCEGEACQVKR